MEGLFTRKLSFTKPNYPKAIAMGVTEFPYREYDSNGNETYYEDSDGYWAKKEYDSNNNRIYGENSRGYWERMEYDSVGYPTYYEDSYGGIKTY